jgi:hypothetical protein
MVTALLVPALELHFRCQLRIACARPILGPSAHVACECAKVVVHVYVELANGLLLACIPSSGLLRRAWQQLDTHIVDLGAGGLHTVPDGTRACIEHCHGHASGVVSGVKMGSAAYAIDIVPPPGYVLQGMWGHSGHRTSCSL